MNIYHVLYLISPYDGTVDYGCFDNIKAAAALIDQLEPTRKERTTSVSGYRIHEYPLNQRCDNPTVYDRNGKKIS